MQPAGGAGGAPTTGAAGGAAEVDRNPRRARPEGQPMTLFLMEIGRQHRPIGQVEEGGFDVNSLQCVNEALRLGDITQVGTTTPPAPQEEKEEEGAGAAAPVRVGYPIYQFEGPETGTHGVDLLKFTTDPHHGGIVGMSYPPYIAHQPGEIHGDMEAALWGGYCFDHPRPTDHHGDYEDLLRGMRLRYGGDNQFPR